MEILGLLYQWKVFPTIALFLVSLWFASTLFTFSGFYFLLTVSFNSLAAMLTFVDVPTFLYTLSPPLSHDLAFSHIYLAENRVQLITEILIFRTLC